MPRKFWDATDSDLPSLRGGLGRTRPYSAPTFERDDRFIPRSAVRATNGIATSSRRRVEDLVKPGPSEPFDTARKLAEISQARSRSQARAQVSSADRRKFHPLNPYAWPSTVSGTAARTTVGRHHPQRFKNPHAVIPCIQRAVRREVLFAKRKHGSHKGPRRRTWLSYVEC